MDRADTPVVGSSRLERVFSDELEVETGEVSLVNRTLNRAVLILQFWTMEGLVVSTRARVDHVNHVTKLVRTPPSLLIFDRSQGV